MKIAEMTPEQLREYNRESKKRQRGREKQEKERLAIPDASDFKLPDYQVKALRKHARDLTRTIRQDIPVTKQDEYIVDGVACVLFGLEKDFTQEIHKPFGMLVGGYFPDAMASEAIAHVHRFPGLLQSTTFAAQYSKFLQEVVEWSRKTRSYSTPEFIQDVKAELAGEYVLKFSEAKLQPKMEPLTETKPEPPVPSDEEIRERGRAQLLNQLRIQNDLSIPLDARHFLDGVPR